MRKAPNPLRAFPDKPIISVASDQRPLSKSQLRDVLLLAYLPESPAESKEIAKLRRSLASALEAATELSKLGTPGMIDSFNYEVLRLQGLVK